MQAQTKVFVGSLPQGSKPEELRTLFERFGEVTECDIMNRCGFIHMATEEQATAAIRALQNASFNGGIITVEKGRMKERGPRPPGGPPRGPGGPGGPGPMRGGPGGPGPMRGGPGGMGDMARRPGGGGPMRGPPMGGVRDHPAPYMRDSRPPMRGGDMRGPPMGGGGMGGMRNGMGGGGGYDAYPEDRFNGYGGEDRRGFALMDRGGRGDVGYGGGVGVRDMGYGSTGARDLGYGGAGAREMGYNGTGAREMGYASPVSSGMYPEERRGGYGAMEERGLYPEDRRAALYPDEREMMERRASAGLRQPMSMAPSYDRGPVPRESPMGNGDMFSRRSPPPMRGGSGGGGYVDRDPYAPPYASMGRVGGAAGPRGGRDMGMGPRRY